MLSSNSFCSQWYSIFIMSIWVELNPEEGKIYIPDYTECMHITEFREAFQTQRHLFQCVYKHRHFQWHRQNRRNGAWFCMCVCTHMHILKEKNAFAMVYMWRSEDICRELALGIERMLPGLDSRRLHEMLSHLTSPKYGKFDRMCQCLILDPLPGVTDLMRGTHETSSINSEFAAQGGLMPATGCFRDTFFPSFSGLE